MMSVSVVHLTFFYNDCRVWFLTSRSFRTLCHYFSLLSVLYVLLWRITGYSHMFLRFVMIVSLFMFNFVVTL